MEKTLSIIKPDAVARHLCGKIINMIEEHGLKIVAQKMIHLSPKQAAMFYAVHKDKSFFDKLVEYMTSGPIIVQVLEGDNAIANYRQLMGNTNPVAADENTIRKLYGISIEQNAVHGSDSPETAEKEIDFFFSEMEIME